MIALAKPLALSSSSFLISCEGQRKRTHTGVRGERRREGDVDPGGVV